MQCFTWLIFLVGLSVSWLVNVYRFFNFGVNFQSYHKSGNNSSLWQLFLTEMK